MAKKETKYIVAVKDYENTIKNLADGTIKMERAASIYKALFENVLFTCDSYLGLKKFIKQNKYNKKDCAHYWEGLLASGHTIATLLYDTDDENFVETCCDNETVIFISNWIK